jgi:hypothetical protein
MRELVKRNQVLAAAVVAVMAGIIAYPAWVINEALSDFMSLPLSKVWEAEAWRPVR